jgi:uncharacterized protein (TIGR02246 family)
MLKQPLRRASCVAVARPAAFVLAATVFARCGVAAAQQPAKAAAPAQAPSSTAEQKPAAGANAREAPIRATAEAFAKAFNAGDAKAIASQWIENGTVVDEQGSLFKGRKAIEDEYAALFKAHPSARIQVAIQSIEFPTPTTAVEDGVTRIVTPGNEPPTASRYTAMHVEQDGKWMMASVRESSMPVASNFMQLQDLGWLVGDWESKSNDVAAHSQARWIANKSFLQRNFSVHRGGMLVSSGTQIIGWDPRSGRVVSWTFDSSGGHGTAAWSATSDGWGLDSAGVTADGVPTSCKDYLIRVPGDDNVFGWRSSDRKLGETTLPDVPEVVFDRVAPKK